MAKIGLYKDAQLLYPISQGGALTSPDDIVADGGAGETVDGIIYLANTQSPLTAGMTTISTELHVSSAYFEVGEVVKIGNEKILITAGSGVDFTISRGHGGTTPETHSVSDVVYSAYDYTNLTFDISDAGAPSQETLVTLGVTLGSLGTNTPGASLTLPDKAFNQTQEIHRRITIPGSTDTGLLTSLYYSLTRIEHETP